MVHRDFQRLGLGSRLTEHCNSLADKAGRNTFVVARNTSRPMFEKFGFKILGREGHDMRKWGGKEDDALLWMMMREPQSSSC